MLLLMINLISSLPADTKDQSCSSGEPEMRSSQRKSLVARLEMSAQLHDPFAAFQECGGRHVEQRQQPPAEAAAIQVSLILKLLRRDMLIIFEDQALLIAGPTGGFPVCTSRSGFHCFMWGKLEIP